MNIIVIVTLVHYSWVFNFTISLTLMPQVFMRMATSRPMRPRPSTARVLP